MALINDRAIGDIIERVVARQELELVHWETVGPPNNFVLRVYIDTPGGVSHADCGAVSNEIGLLLDVEDLVPHRYTLEVSSPGLERGLYKLADYERFAGSKVKLKLFEPIGGRRNFSGKLLGIKGDRVLLDTGSTGNVEIPFDRIVKANIQYEF